MRRTPEATRSEVSPDGVGSVNERATPNRLAPS